MARWRALDKKGVRVVLVYRVRATRLSGPAGLCARANWPIDDLNGLEHWHDMRASKTDCMRAGLHT